MGKNVLITGATGMIGSLVLKHCLESDEVASVISLARRPSGIQHEKRDCKSFCVTAISNIFGQTIFKFNHKPV
ncbi:MAG: NAD-dependent epimerase/dehydratase family protein [Candidatus Thiodiazotropha sp.]